MKQIPILFSTDMVQAKKEGRKTMTRRVINPKTPEAIALMVNLEAGVDVESCKEELIRTCCPYGKEGDVLWTREKFFKGYRLDENDNIPENAEQEYWYYADTCDARPGDVSEDWCYHMYGADKSLYPRWKPSIHMPKEAARIWDEVTSIRVERLHDITEADAIKEGVKLHEGGKHYLNYLYKKYCSTQFIYCENTAKASFKSLWESINDPNDLYAPHWRDNPWVWVVEFKVLSTTGKPKNLL